jgi:glycosyltransferase involved in cell wall biosynthesis
MDNLSNKQKSAELTLHRDPGATRKISIICGTVTRFDAISECALACLEACAKLGVGVPIDVRIYCLDSDVADSRIFVLGSVHELISEPFYQTSDIIIHHFGIFSELHSALGFSPRSAYVVVTFYGVTPPQFVPKAIENLINESFIQISLFEHANEIVVNSGYLGNELRRIGVNRPLEYIELYGINSDELIIIPRSKDDDFFTNVIYCGRFVHSKQVVELVDALDICVEEFANVRLTLVGVENYSDSSYIDEIKTRAAVANFEILFRTNRSSREVAEIIAASDLLVLPSLHEGFGVPVAEALALATPVVCSDAGSLPEVSGSLALVYELSAPKGLENALREAIRARLAGNVLTSLGECPYDEWATAARVFSLKYRRSSFVSRWRSRVIKIFSKSEIRPLSTALREDCVAGVFSAAAQQAVPVGAQLIGRFVMLKTLGRVNREFNDMFDVLHKWMFGFSADENGIDYWRREFRASGTIDKFVLKISMIDEVRLSSSRRRALAGMYEVLMWNIKEGAAGHIKEIGDGVSAIDRAEVTKILAESRTALAFVRDAYRLILGRESDPEGLAVHLRFAVDPDNRSSMIEAFFSSNEYKERYQSESKSK